MTTSAITVMLQWDERSSIFAIIGLPRTVCRILAGYVTDRANITTEQHFESTGYVFIKVYHLRLAGSATPYTRQQTTVYLGSQRSR